MNPYARHKARVYALQSLYSWLISRNDLADIEAHFLAEKNFKKVDIEYYKSLLGGVASDPEKLDQTMIPYLDRSISGLNPIELTIMRMAIYEMINCKDVPYKVIINEALELAKEYGAEDGFKYVNGILDRVVKKIRADEM